MDFSLIRREGAGRIVTLTPAGEVDLRSAGALRAAIQDTCGYRVVDLQPPVRQVLDLAASPDTTVPEGE